MDDLTVMTTIDTAGVAFETFRRAPVANWRDLTGGQPILVIAPHPDDETLGCGGLIAETAAKGVEVIVAVMTDGARSHPNSRTHPCDALRDLREREVEKALQTLGVDQPLINFFRQPDGFLGESGPEADECVEMLVRLVDEHGIGSMFVTWGSDPHPDHQAAYDLAMRVRRQRPEARLFAYPIWGLTLAADEIIHAPYRSALRYEIRPFRSRKRAAIDCFQSQLGRVIGDDPEGFSLSVEDVERFCSDFEIFIDLTQQDVDLRRHISSVPTEHFDHLYRQNADPWNYIANGYEQDRFTATIEALPKQHYRRACEIGCSIGVLTEKLAGRCEKIIGIDCSAAALEQARLRFAPLGNAYAHLMRVPEQLPDGHFDLIVLSEVLYFFSHDDLLAVERFVADRLEAGGTCMLVNYLGDTESPLSGAEAAETFIAASQPRLKAVSTRKFDGFRIDVLERVSEAGE
ncbi:MAG: PIG-L family deacetylase [Beijerinckiaceae bacterium]|nr:PIG-L family deacetylase [Beijerinckiaceae bacterium]